MWIPDENTLDHSGRPIAGDADFFVPPPAQIGKVMSAHSSLSHSAEPTPVTRPRVRASLITGSVVFALCWLWATLMTWRPGEQRGFWEWAICAIALAAALAWLDRKPSYSCSYVGTHGVARFACYGARSTITFSQVFCFESAVSLKASARNIYVNGGCVHTEFSFRWFEASGHLVARIAGVYRGRDSVPPADDRYAWALAAESAWTEYLAPTVVACVRSGIAWRFCIGWFGYIELRPDCMAWRGKCIPYDDLDLRLERGYVVLRRKNERTVWYKFDNARRARYADIENAGVMLLVAQHNTGRPLDMWQIARDVRYHTLHFAP